MSEREIKVGGWVATNIDGHALRPSTAYRVIHINPFGRPTVVDDEGCTRVLFDVTPCDPPPPAPGFVRVRIAVLVDVTGSITETIGTTDDGPLDWSWLIQDSNGGRVSFVTADLPLPVATPPSVIQGSVSDAG